MKRTVNLLEEPIFSSLTKLALPIMATAFVQMAYNMIDMLWIGRLSNGAVASVGTAGMYLWLASGFSMLAKMGGQVKVGQSLGAKELDKAANYAKNALQMGIIMGILYGISMIICSKSLIGFFQLNGKEVIKDAEIYLIVAGGGVVFSFLNQILTGILTAMGNSQMPFITTMIGLGINIILDPLLIFGIGPFLKLGVLGAALATVLAQAIVTIVFFFAVKKDTILFDKIKIRTKLDSSCMKCMIRIGFPSAIQSILFTFISMVIARLIASWGDNAIAVQKVGSQIESISWMTADGFAAAVNAFVAQNYGADNKKRVKKGYLIAMGVVLIWGLFCSWLLIFYPEFIFCLFLPDEQVRSMGVDYLRILGYSQLFMCIEITTAGAFSGLGRTIPPSIEGVILTAARIPLAIMLSGTILGLNGIWWSISISSILKGIVLFLWFLFAFLIKKEEKHKNILKKLTF